MMYSFNVIFELRSRILFGLCLIGLLTNSSLIGQATRYFEVRVQCGHGAWQDTSFIIAARDSSLIQSALAELNQPVPDRRLVGGVIDYSSGGFNRNGDHWFQWHVKPDEWEFGDVAIEVCNGCPYSDLDQDTSYWVGTVGQFCPWSGKLSREVDGPVTPIDPPIPGPEISLFPNPANLNFQIRLNSDATFRLSVFNLIGKRVIPERVVQAGENINVSALPNGLYLVQLRFGKRQSKVLRLQITH